MIEYSTELENILSKEDILNVAAQLFSTYRLVDIKSNRVCDCNSDEITLKEGECFDIWGRHKPCENCISYRAFVENEEQIKFEFMNNKVLMITANPVKVKGETYVLELIKDITSSMIVADSQEKENVILSVLINRINEFVVKDSKTNLYNEKYIEKKLTEDIKEVVDNKIKLFVSMIDIDDMDTVLYEHGAGIGDYIINKIVEIIEIVLLKKDCWVARYKRNNFVIVFTDEPEEDVTASLERIQQKINNVEFKSQNETFHISVSHVIHEYSQEKTAQELVKNIVEELNIQKEA